MESITVKLGKRSYPIYIGRGILKDIGRFVKEHFFGRKIMVVTDSNVKNLYARKIQQSLENYGLEVYVEVIPAGESSKSLNQARLLYDAALNYRLDRTSAILALGGGVTGDLAGFVAATYMRGISFIQVPTSLLAQVDSSVGGKVAVNLEKAKNIVGAFYQPILVAIDPDTLSSLPEREFKEGLAEVIKYGIIKDAEFFRWLEQNNKKLKPGDEKITYVIKKSCQIKGEIVSEDETEHGLRMILNFGHTVGHALEGASGYGTLLHGEAVALGMILESKIALKRGLIDEGTFFSIENLITYCVPVNNSMAWDKNKLLECMIHDKKNVNENIVFILPKGIGEVEAYYDVTSQEILEALER